MNWGKGIVITLIVFVAFITTMSVYMFGVPQDDYDHDYYERGLSFDKDYAREANVVKDHAQPQILLRNQLVQVNFTAAATGTIKFQRPSSDRQDKVYALNSATLSVPTTSLATGKWQLIIDWKSKGRAYLYQHEITIK